MADSASAVYQKIMNGNWEEWVGNSYCKLKRRKVKRKFARVSREEITEGIDEGEETGYGKYDEGDLCERDMFFDDRFDFYENYQ